MREVAEQGCPPQTPLGATKQGPSAPPSGKITKWEPRRRRPGLARACGGVQGSGGEGAAARPGARAPQGAAARTRVHGRRITGRF